MGKITGEYVLELHGIVKLFPGVRALDGMELRVRPGKVHVIAGENGAGKSTLMKIINGDYAADEGEVIYKGHTLGKRSIMETIHMGISMIRQEMNPIRDMTVAENIFLGREPQKVKGFVDFNKLYEDTNKLLMELEIPLQAGQKMATLSIAAQQQVEIAKAISCNASVIIMDEPTSAIADAEVRKLFSQIKLLKEKNVAIIYITHKMDEIKQIADDLTIIRDGKWISSGPASEYPADKIISLMVGRTIEHIFPKKEVPIREIALEVRNLSSRGIFRDVSFQVHKGEILGFSGLVGAGRSEVMRAIFGLLPYQSGEILLNGQTLRIRRSEDAIHHGIAMVSENRREEGIIPIRSARENIVLPFIDQFSRFALVDRRLERKTVASMIEKFSIRVSSPEQEMQNLSGGNQQKVVLAKWLIGNIDVLILDEPTRGIDVGAKSEIHRLICEFAEKGLAIIMISSELPEILSMSDRVIVMREGRIAGELSRAEATQESIMALAT